MGDGSFWAGEVIFEHPFQFEPKLQVESDCLVVVAYDRATQPASLEIVEHVAERDEQQVTGDRMGAFHALMDIDVTAVPVTEHHGPDHLAVRLSAEAGIPRRVVDSNLLADPFAKFLVAGAVIDERNHMMPPFSNTQSVDTQTVSLLVSTANRAAAA